MRIKIGYILIILSVAFFAAYYFIPMVRYYFIPITGGTKAPTYLWAHKINTQSNLTPSDSQTIFSNETQRVSAITEVPSQNGWINSAPLELQSLYHQNKSVLIYFWTYSCINCIRTTQAIEELWCKYKNNGLTVIGVHNPEFDFDNSSKNILAAIEKASITFPVILDGDMKISNLFANKFWPSIYLINPSGMIVYAQLGERDHSQTESAIRAALAKSSWQLPPIVKAAKTLKPTCRKTTPELFAGTHYTRREYGNKQQPVKGQLVSFKLPPKINQDEIYLEGEWKCECDYVQAQSPGKIILSYQASAPYIVLAPEKDPLTVEILLDDHAVPLDIQGPDIRRVNEKTIMDIATPRLYFPIAHSAPYDRHTITIFVQAGIRFYSFNFGAYE